MEIDQISLDKKYMHRCLQLALNGQQNAKPNPMVGAVIVANNRKHFAVHRNFITADQYADNFRMDCKFEIYRTDFRKTGPCRNCEHYRFCAGDAYHSWNFDEMKPNLCLKGVLF